MLLYGYGNKGKKYFYTLEEFFAMNKDTPLYRLYKNLIDKMDTFDGRYKLYGCMAATYPTLCKFNNTLIDVYTIKNTSTLNLDFLTDFLDKHSDLEDSIDTKCREVYTKLNIWYKRLIDNPDNLDSVKWEVVKLMKYFERNGIFRVSSCNLKSNYHDYVIKD